jgi:hypothetical protein
MGAAINSSLSTLSDHVFKLLERVEHRVASNPSDREEVFRLRYDAYRRIGFLKPRPDDKLYDLRYDDDPKAWITMTFVDGELAGTVRVNAGACENAVLPGLQAFADILAPRLCQRQTLVEFTRLASRRRSLPPIPSLRMSSCVPGSWRRSTWTPISPSQRREPNTWLSIRAPSGRRSGARRATILV